MEKARLGISGHPSLKWVFLASFFICSCSMPRVVVMKDPLNASEHNDLGLIYEQKGMLGFAEKEYLKAVEKDGAWFLPLFNLGNLSYDKGDLPAAEQYYRRALILDDTNADVMNNLAIVLHDLGRNPEAIKLITSALSEERKPEYLDTYEKIIGGPAEEDEEIEVPSPPSPPVPPQK
jgi:tetratricopeptide (TPR) repeat protein